MRRPRGFVKVLPVATGYQAVICDENEVPLQYVSNPTHFYDVALADAVKKAREFGWSVLTEAA